MLLIWRALGHFAPVRSTRRRPSTACMLCAPIEILCVFMQGADQTMKDFLQKLRQVHLKPHASCCNMWLAGHAHGLQLTPTLLDSCRVV